MAMSAAVRKKLEKQSAAAQKKASAASRKIPAACGLNLKTPAAKRKKMQSAKCKALRKTVRTAWATVTRNRKKIHSSGHRYSNIGLRSGYVD